MMKKALMEIWKDDSGLDGVPVAAIITVIAVVMAVGLGIAFGPKVRSLLNKAGSEMDDGADFSF